jgi:hypothetical protein
MKLLKLIKGIFLFLWTMIAGMYGGQKNKGARRFGIPFMAFFIALTEKFKQKAFIFLLFIPILIMGYGQNSFLYKVFSSDFIVRIVYGALLSIPFIFFSVKRWLFALITLAIAYSIKEGSLGYITWFGDILIEDIIRYGTLGLLFCYNIFVPLKKINVKYK